MWRVIRKQFAIQARDWAELSLVIPGGAVFGMVLHYFIIRNDYTADHYFALGTILACCMAVILSAIMILGQFCVYFNTEVSMGCLRKQFLVSFYIVGFTFMLGYLALIIMLNLFENAVCRRLYPELTCEVDFFPYFLKWGIPAIIVLCIISIFCSILLLRFGRKAFWILWACWMFGFVGIPGFSEAAEDAPNSLMGRIGSAAAGFIKGIPLHILIVTGIAVSVFCLIMSWVLIRKQQVNS